MDTTAAPPVSTEQALDAFHASARLLRHPTLRARSRLVRDHLETYLDTACERWLTTGELALVAAERQIDSVGAVARVIGPEPLMSALPGFLDPSWLLPETGLASAQVRIASELAAWLVAVRLVDRAEMACSVIEVKVQADRARRHLGERAGCSGSSSRSRAFGHR